MKRFFSFLLALAMLMAMGIPVFADEPAPGSVNQPEKIISEDTEKENGGITYYYNNGGCLLAKYDNNKGYGVTY